MLYYIDKLKYLLNRLYFNSNISKVLDSAPVIYEKDDSVTIVTMLGHNTLYMYLVAIKSFMIQFGYGTIEVINDGTLTEKDIDILKKHVPGILFSFAKDVNTLKCPTYISWKRLLRIAELAKKSYVIQLDSDTVALAPLIEIHDKVKANEGFLIGCNRWRTPIDVNFLNKIVVKWGSQHVQAQAEMVFRDIDFFKDGTKYLRACAGFAGYPKNFAAVSEIEKLSLQIEDKIGKKWTEWGSEQTATMCLISKTKNASILPWPRYQNYMYPLTKEPVSSATFVHFIGPTRFINSKYTGLCKTIFNNEI